MNSFENVGVFICINAPTFSNLVILCIYLPMKMEQSVPKRRHIEFRRRGITQKKAYSLPEYDIEKQNKTLARRLSKKQEGWRNKYAERENLNG